MIKRVKLDENNSLTEIDWKATCRQAQELKDYIEAAPAEEASKYDYDKRVRPIIEQVLNGTVEFPFPADKDPYDIRAIMEGYYPELEYNFRQILYNLIFKIKGYPDQFNLSTHKNGVYNFETFLKEDRIEDSGGNVFVLCWFED
jgi:hypothetical protein